MRPFLLIAALLAAACAPSRTAPPSAEFRWGGDAEGGAPFVEADPADASRVRGFDVEIGEMIARGLGREPRFVQVAWVSIEQSVARGDFEVGLSGMEDRPDLRSRNAVSLPYYAFLEVLAVRPADAARYRRMADLAGRRVGTLAATQAWQILQEAQRDHGVIPVSYDDNVHPYSDLMAGRLDAVLLDNVIASEVKRRSGAPFIIQPEPVDTGYYVAIFAAGNTALRDSADRVLRDRMRDGSLERTFRRWGVWNETQAGHFARVLAAAPGESVGGTEARGGSAASYLPALLRAAGATLAISVLAMALAVVAGLAIAAGRVYGPAWVQGLLAVYVEVMRGTPVLLQLFVIYYGLSGVVRLPALAAAIIGLGLNYAAYESEIYRAALLAIPRAQLEAGRTLGLSELQILRLVRAPQALRLALAPMTNDFVALLKDSSLVSVITVVELTKQTAIYATNIGSWLVPGLLCAMMYLALSLPLSRLAGWLERRWRIA